MRNYFTFGDYDSRDFGVFITRDGVYNAPKRVYRQIQVPGRNGDLMLDEGRFENIDVTYPCLIYAGFNANIEGLRNALLSQNGYVRITDSYHHDEYRLGCFSEEFSVVPKVLGDGGTFDITFNCKPQRFLLSGEESITYPPGGANSPNLIPYPYYLDTRTINGVTFTDNGDGTITVNGTNTGSSTAEFLIAASSQNIIIPSGSYLLSGCTGGSATTYLLQWNPAGVTTINNYNGSSNVNLSSDIAMRLEVKVIAGATVNNVTFKPMLRLASDTDSKWYPYWDGTKQIYNPTLFASKPLIRVTGTGTVGIGDNTITVASGYTYVDIDSEIQDCYCGTQNANSLVTFSNRKFPELQPGINGISLGTGVTSVQITPRWFRL